MATIRSTTTTKPKSDLKLPTEPKPKVSPLPKSSVRPFTTSEFKSAPVKLAEKLSPPISRTISTTPVSQSAKSITPLSSPNSKPSVSLPITKLSRRDNSLLPTQVRVIAPTITTTPSPLSTPSYNKSSTIPSILPPLQLPSLKSTPAVLSHTKTTAPNPITSPSMKSAPINPYTTARTFVGRGSLPSARTNSQILSQTVSKSVSALSTVTPKTSLNSTPITAPSIREIRNREVQLAPTTVKLPELLKPPVPTPQMPQISTKYPSVQSKPVSPLESPITRSAKIGEISKLAASVSKLPSQTQPVLPSNSPSPPQTRPAKATKSTVTDYPDNRENRRGPVSRPKPVWRPLLTQSDL